MDGAAASAAEGVEHPDGAAPSEGQSAAASTAGVDAQSTLLTALGQLSPTLDSKTASMKSEAKKAKAERKRLAKELRNAEKRRRRLRARCKELPAEDLLEVLAMRQVRGAEAASSQQEPE